MNQYGHFDIAPFATVLARAADGTTVLRWEEPRRVHRVVLEFDRPVPTAAGVTVHYWRRYWPETGEGAANTAELGWAPGEDWHTGEWKQADVRLASLDGALVVTFAPLGETEFPHLTGRAEEYRRTNQLRISIPENWPDIANVQAHTMAHWRSVDLLIQCSSDVTPGSLSPSAYNGRITEWRVDGEEARLRADVLITQPDRPSDPSDETIITLDRNGPWLSFLPRQVLEHGEMLIPSHGLVVRAPEGAVAAAGGACVYDRIAEVEEQTLEGALAAMPDPDALYFALGCPGARQKFRLHPDGELVLPGNYVTRVPASDTNRLARDGELRVRLGLGADRFERSRLDGYLPILVSRTERNGLRLGVTALAVPLQGAESMEDLAGDAPTVCLLELEVAALDSQPITIPITVRDGDRAEQLEVRGERVYANRDGAAALRMRVACEGLELGCGPEGVQLEGVLAAGGRARATVLVPFIALESPEELSALDALGFERELEAAARYWRTRSAACAQLTTPEQHLNDFHRGHISHVLITDDREVGADRIHTRVGSFNYGNFSNESCMIITCLDRRGLHEDTDRRLDTFLHYQGTVPLPGNYASHDGIFYGSGGYECGGYNQHHGWVLWGLGEHYRLTRNDEWLARAAEGMVRGCDWIIRERQATRILSDDGVRAPQWGLLPAGSLEDVTDYHHWLSTNAFSYFGLWSVADALQRARHPQAERLSAEAESYRQDIERAFRRQAALSPVVRLRDGTWVPHFPSRIHLRGRDLGWIRETLEGAIHLVCTGIVPAHSEAATWILKDYEDNRYVRAPYGYHIEDDRFEEQWFSRGGFSMQPNLLWGPVAYLLRDEIQHFLRAFFNGFASAFRSDVRMLTEHPLPELGRNWGDHFKTSDEAQALHWLRMMLLREEGDELWLGQAAPRSWMASGTPVEVENYVTWFGPLSYRLSHSGDRTLMELSPPVRNAPSRLHVRLRHPEGKPLTRVLVGGKEVLGLDPLRELVTLECPSGPAVIEGFHG